MSKRWGTPHESRATWRSVLASVHPSTPHVHETVPPGLLIAERYLIGDVLGSGGTSVVVRAHDERLSRPVALKIVRTPLARSTVAERFEEEARMSARLQHPGIVPIYDLGWLDDGRVWFTMKVVEGKTFESLSAEFHRNWRVGAVDSSGLRRLVQRFARVTETVAYAHSLGVLHRDLKPTNMMLGDFGEVLVVDWGFAKLLAQQDDANAAPLSKSSHPAHTQLGAILGTPAYMAPEQARGEPTIGRPADVFALGATLYDLLCERPPRIERSVQAQLEAVVSATPICPPSERSVGLGLDVELDRICMRALAHDPAERYRHAGALAADLNEWLDGARRRDRAMVLVQRADEWLAQAVDASLQAQRFQEEAAQCAAVVAPNARSADKEEMWALEDRAADASATADDARAEAVHALRSALTHAPELEEARRRLATHFRTRHSMLESQGRHREARAAARELADNDRAGAHSAYLSGTGAVTLVTEPPGAEVRLHRFATRGRRLEPVFERVLGNTPLKRVPVEMGSYLLTLHREGHEEVHYPIRIDRQAVWDGAAEEDGGTIAIPLPVSGSCGPSEAYVPAGWCWIGDDDLGHTLPLARRWIDGFVMQRDPVTVGDYVRFLEAIRSRDGDVAALELQPLMGDGGEPFLARDGSGAFTGIRTDQEGFGWDRIPLSPRAPAVYLTIDRATAYAQWLSETTGHPWQLPTEAMWQKAARGVDARHYPWGNHFEPSWCRMRSTDDAIHFVSVDAMPTDRSPYGVRGLAGNVMDWVVGEEPAALRVGGSCAAGPLGCRTTHRMVTPREQRTANTGFRLIRKNV